MRSRSGNTEQLQSLLELAAQGDEYLYEVVIEQASLRLLHLTRRMLTSYPHLRRWEETDDVFQTAALRLHRSLAEVKPDSVRRFMGLAATQIRRTLIDLARHHFGPHGQHAKHHTDGGLPPDDPAAALARASETNEPETLIAWAAFHEAVATLPEETREVFELIWYANLPQRQISELLGISESTVKRRWRSAQLALGARLDGDDLLAEECGRA